MYCFTPAELQQSYLYIMKPVPWRGCNDQRHRRRTKARWGTEAGIELNLWESKIAHPIMESNTTRLPEEQVNGTSLERLKVCWK